MIYYREKKERNGEEEMERNERVVFFKIVLIYFLIYLNYVSCFDNVCIVFGVGLKFCRL